MNLEDLFRLGARAALRKIEMREIEPSAYWQSCVSRILEREPEIGAFVSLALAHEAIVPIGDAMLRGIPVGIKDIIDTIDFPTRYGSPIYNGFRPPRDAYVVAALKNAGAMIAGKTETTEFAGPSPARTRNPHRLSATPGGSSAGSAAAVASGMLPLALGTQTAGSVIRPAAYCGVVGFKPSFGQIDTTGIRPAAVSLDTVGLFARDVMDAGLLAAVLSSDPDLAIGPSDKTSLRIGLWRPQDFSKASSAVQAAFGDIVDILGRRGIPLHEIPETDVAERAGDAARLILAVETSRSTAFEMRHAPEQVSALLKETIAFGEQRSAVELADARQTIRRAAVALEELMANRGIDILITPAAPDEAPEGLGLTGDPKFNRIWTALGVPVLTLPQCYGPRGLPIGIQLVGRQNQDRRLLEAAVEVESLLRLEYGDIFVVR